MSEDKALAARLDHCAEILRHSGGTGYVSDPAVQERVRVSEMIAVLESYEEPERRRMLNLRVPTESRIQAYAATVSALIDLYRYRRELQEE